MRVACVLYDSPRVLDVPEPLVMEATLEVFKTAPREPTAERVAKQLVGPPRAPGC